jgi:uncharacterized membrane protein YgdD (TMEM256/DUF423 family)
MTQKRILLWAIGFISIAIILGAFGAHALKERITVERITSFETGVRYQMYQGLALLALAGLIEKWKFNFGVPINMLIIGTCLFSLSIYGLSLQDLVGMNLKFLGPITPLGGSILITGWVWLGVKILKLKA